ncbi:hypothetical protein [Caproiciproducens faecalis]|uniref:Dockerin domain-containing protein n=1 Tax=Caproiciproducens faecalis TaxID=2820301 RepID=A0ABS7DIT0_9FIRM|nr:hypothetical protein [Caproiciproducens faecalis]MBW7571196.1 hypothetical protein [Caproiciproducens faecalis]
MKIRRLRRMIFGLVCLCAAILVPLTVACYAEDYPDISAVEPSLYYADRQQFFHRPGTGFVLISTDSLSSTKAALLDSGGKLDYSSVRGPTSIKFAYEAACLCGNYLYLAGNSPVTENCALIGRLDLSTGKCILNQVLNVRCDFSRDFSADDRDRVTLVTVPAGEQINAGTPAAAFLFDAAHNNGVISPQAPDPEPSSSEPEAPASSAPESSAPESSAPTSSSVNEMPADLPSKIENYDYPGPVTVEGLQSELDANGLNQNLRVFSSNQKEIKSGTIGTGHTVVVMKDGKTVSACTAVIPGDLDGSGTITDYDCRLLYEYFTQTEVGGTPTLSGPYLEAAKISDDSLADKSGRGLQTGDLLKIKKLIK